MGIFKFLKQLLSQETAKPVKASTGRIKDVTVSISGPSDEELRRQAAQHYAKNKDKIAAKRKAAREREKAKSPEQKLEEKKQQAENKIRQARQSLADMRAIKDITHYVVSTSGDGRVCAACKKHDNKKYDVNDAVVGKNYPPFCDECRCVTLPCFKDVKMSWG